MSHDEAVMDMHSFMERTGDDWDFAKELIGIFLYESPHLLQEIANAAAERDGPRLRHSAHALKGSISNFTSGDAFRAAAALEEIGRAEDFSHVDAARIQMEQEFARLSDLLTRLSSRDRTP